MENKVNESNDDLSNEKSLEIIHQMINQAKTKINDNGNEWILWGSLIFLASLSTYLFIEMDYRYIFMGWNVIGVIVIIVLTYQLFRKKSKAVRTYLDDLLRLFDIGFIICLFIIIFSINVGVNANFGFGFLLMIYAFLMLIQGGAMKFRPLIIGAIANWIGCIAIFLNDEFKYDMLITCAAVFIGYIIPGIILKAQFKKKQ